LSGEDISALTGFYSQVDQMNRGMDYIDSHKATGFSAELEQEHQRLVKKASEMRHPTERTERIAESGFFAKALSAVRRHQE
jgi:hypothetical protein